MKKTRAKMSQLVTGAKRLYW